MRPPPKKVALLLLLTIFFLIDDLLFYLLVVDFYHWPIHPAVFSLVSIVIIALNFWLAVVVLRILRKTPTTGPPGMIGKAGVVIKENANGMQVQVQGEIWRATSEDLLGRGDRIIVQSVQGLMLVVKKKIQES